MPSLPPLQAKRSNSNNLRKTRLAVRSFFSSGAEALRANAGRLVPCGAGGGADAIGPGIESVTEKLSEIAGSLNRAADVDKVKVIDLKPADAPWPPPNELCKYSLLSHIPLPTRRALVERAADTNEFNRAMGLMVGMGLGDAVGAPLEFLPVQEAPGGSYFDLEALSYHGEFNKFRLQRGQWTDDAAMGLCMADSLILHCRFDGGDMRKRFWCWWYRGYNNAFLKDGSRGHSVGLGGNIAKSLQDCQRRVLAGQPLPPVYGSTSQDSGNGSLMRLAPIIAFFHSSPAQTLHDMARRSSYTTHPGILAAEACAFLAHLLQSALALPPDGADDVQAFMRETCESYWDAADLENKEGEGYDEIKQLVRSSPVDAREGCWDWRGRRLAVERTLRARGRHYNGYPVSAGYFGSFCMDGLAMALWAVYNSTSFDDAVVRSVNLLGDADSHGSIAGQLAGAIYGYKAISPRLLGWLTKWDDHGFAIRGLLLHSLGANSREATASTVAMSPSDCTSPSSRSVAGSVDLKTAMGELSADGRIEDLQMRPGEGDEDEEEEDLYFC